MTELPRLRAEKRLVAVDLGDGITVTFDPAVTPITSLLPVEHPRFEALFVIDRWMRAEGIASADLATNVARLAKVTATIEVIENKTVETR